MFKYAKAIIISNEKTQEYDLYSYMTPETNMYLELVLNTTDYSAVKRDFSDVKSISIQNSSGLECYSTSIYTSVVNISLSTAIYGAPGEAISVKLKNVSLEEQFKKLQEEVNPTINETDMTTDEFKDLYVLKSKAALEEFLAFHPITSDCHGGKEGVYSITKEKQDLMAQNYMAYQLEKAINPNAVLTWNESGKECEVWTEEEFITLLLQIKAYVYPRVALQQKYETLIREAMDKVEVKKIVFDYENIPE